MAAATGAFDMSSAVKHSNYHSTFNSQNTKRLSKH